MTHPVIPSAATAAAILTFKGEYSFLSNFYTTPVSYGGLTYPSSEAAYQAAKCANPAEKIAFTRMGPVEAKQAGRTVALRSDWEEVKVVIMAEVVHAKFEQSARLQEKLLATGDRPLIEGNWWGDTFWGVCRGRGTNWLGVILMRERVYYRGGNRASTPGSELPGT
jgi:hypothetical protein